MVMTAAVEPRYACESQLQRAQLQSIPAYSLVISCHPTPPPFPTRSTTPIHPHLFIESFGSLIFRICLLCSCSLLDCILIWIEVSSISGSHNLFSRCSRTVIANVISDCIVKKSRLLTYNSKARAKVMNIIIFNVYSINQDLSILKIIESLKELEDSRLSAT